MKRIALALAAIGLVGLIVTVASAQTPAVTSLSMQTAVASVGHHPYYGPGPAHGYGHYGRPWHYPVPRVAVVPYAIAPPAYVVPAVPYYCPPQASFYYGRPYGRPRLSVGVAF